MVQNEIVQKLWNLCHILRDSGINYPDYVSELALLLFIKIEDANFDSGLLQKHRLPKEAQWGGLIARKSNIEELFSHYKTILAELGKSKDPVIYAIYNGASTNLQRPKHLYDLVVTLDKINAFGNEKDDLGDLYEGLLEKTATESKKGAGQYFTPRPLINSIVRLVKPQPKELIQDPAAGMSGFLIAANAYIKEQSNDYTDLSLKDQNFQKNKAFMGMELVANTRRLALMNCLLHGMEGGKEGVVLLGDTLGEEGKKLPLAHLILSNPPFGTARGGGMPERDFPYPTSNKQLAFLQHIYLGLKSGGRAAVVLPDNVMFESGIGVEVRRDLMEKCNLHTILRLPTGIFYAHGVKTNILFFQKGTAEKPRQRTHCTKKVWVYDMRTDMPSFGKRTPFDETHLKPFEEVYGEDPNGQSPRIDEGEEGRFRCFDRDYIRNELHDSLDISWAKSDSVTGSPNTLAAEAMRELGKAMQELDSLMRALGAEDEADAQRDALFSALNKENKE